MQDLFLRGGINIHKAISSSLNYGGKKYVKRLQFGILIRSATQMQEWTRDKLNIACDVERELPQSNLPTHKRVATHAIFVSQ
jgi:hypothetical protein